MMSRNRFCASLAAAVVGTAFAATLAVAADPPRWVAALFIQAQKAVGLRWNPVPGSTGYKVLRSTTPGAGHKEIAAPAQPQFIDTTIEPGLTYYYVLQSVAGAETSANSEERSVAIPGEKKVEVLKPPEWVNVALAQTTEFGKITNRVSLAWRSTGPTVAFNLYRSTVAGKDYQMLTSTGENVYVDTAVEAGKTYYYVLSALDANFVETPMSAEKSIEVKEEQREEKREAAARKEKQKIFLRRAKLAFTVQRGPWGELAQPISVAVNSRGEFYVADFIQQKIFVFDRAGQFLFAFGEQGGGDGQLAYPMHIDISPDDELFVSMMDPRVEVFDLSGRPKRSFKLLELLPQGVEHTVAGMAFNPDNWYVSDDGASAVYELDYKTGKVQSTLGGSVGEAAGQFRAQKRLFYSDKKKSLVVADAFNFRIQIFEGDKPTVQFGSYGNTVGQFSRLLTVLEDDFGDIMTVDFQNATVQTFGWDGSFKYVLGEIDGVSQVALTGATGAARLDKRLYIADKLAAQVIVYDMTDEIGLPEKKK